MAFVKECPVQTPIHTYSAHQVIALLLIIIMVELKAFAWVDRTTITLTLGWARWASRGW